MTKEEKRFYDLNPTYILTFYKQIKVDKNVLNCVA